jgi:hypothetical protein
MIPAETFVGALTATQAIAVVRAATAGPALPGASSWFIDGTSTGFELHADSPAWSPGVTVVARQVRIAAGAALLNMRVAVRALGVSADVELLPDAARRNVLGIVHTHNGLPASAVDLVLGRAQQSPRVTAALWSGEPVRNALRRAARTEGAWLATIGQRQQQRFDDLAGAGTPPRQLVAVLGTLDDGPLAQLRAGLGLQRALLIATTLGLQPVVEPHPADEPAKRQLMRELLGGALWPQMVIRVNYR